MKHVNRIHRIMATAHPAVLELCDEIASDEITTMGQVRAEFGQAMFNRAHTAGLVEFEALGCESLYWPVSLTVDGMAVANHVLACRELENAMGNDLERAMAYFNGDKHS